MTPTEILERIPSTRILVVGDAMYDDYEFGRVERICPEAPVPVFIPERQETRPGGAANVANQIRALGADVCEAFGANRSTKTRYMVGAHLLLRMDEDKQDAPGPDDIRHIRSAVDGFDAVVLSDYAKGWLSWDMCRQVIEVAREYNIPVIVDPKGPDWHKFTGCELICPSTSDGFERAAFVTAAAIPNILWKRGAQGMTLCTADGAVHEIPAIARRCYDVVGAGDTIAAVVAAGLAAGASKLEAATLAALAAGWVVGEVGTTVCSLEKLKELVNAR